MTESTSNNRFVVIARDGLRLRSGARRNHGLKEFREVFEKGMQILPH